MTKRVIAVCGQSNELGQGNVSRRTSAYGCPTKDPIPPLGTAATTFWSSAAEELGKAGIWARFTNNAVSSTSLPYCWVGTIRTWTAGALYVLGTYTVQSGNLYKITAMSGPNAPIQGFAGATPPAWPGSGSVTDNQLTWAFQRAATALDIFGRVFQPTDAEFDPNGYIAAALTSISSLIGYDEKWVLWQNGQADATSPVPRQVYRAAMNSFTLKCRNSGYKVLLGFTVYIGTGVYPWYLTDLIPGRADALLDWANDPNVAAALNLTDPTYGLGILATNPADGSPGLISDSVHCNDAGFMLGGQKWAQWCVNQLGWKP